MVDSKYGSVMAEKEFTVFYERWRTPVRRVLAIALGGVVLADEAIDEAMTRALAHWDRLRDYERPDGWLYRVGLIWVRGTFRKRRYELLSDLEPDSHSSHDPLPDLI